MKQPLYQQIIDYLQNEIDSGRLPVGAQVPTEKELSAQFNVCLLYTSPSPRDGLLSRMPSSA